MLPTAPPCPPDRVKIPTCKYNRDINIVQHFHDKKKISHGFRIIFQNKCKQKSWKRNKNLLINGYCSFCNEATMDINASTLNRMLRKESTKLSSRILLMWMKVRKGRGSWVLRQDEKLKEVNIKAAEYDETIKEL